VLPPPAAVIGQLFRQAAGPQQLREANALHFVVEAGTLLRHGCAVQLSPRLATLKLEGFREHWNASVLHAEEGAFVLQVPVAGSFWQRCCGREPALEVYLCLAPPQGEPGGRTEVSVEIRPVRCTPERAAALLANDAPQLVQSLRTFLHVDPERRLLARVPFAHPVGVFPVRDGLDLGDPVVCLGKDISLKGISLYAPEEPASPRLYVQSLLTPELARVALLGKVVRVRPCPDGRCEVAAAFVDTPETWTEAPPATVALRR
jgi:hypothetical protein